LIESPSKLAVVIVRVEPGDKGNSEDVKQAQTIFSRIDIEGPEIKEFPILDLLSSFDEALSAKETSLIDSIFKIVPLAPPLPTN